MNPGFIISLKDPLAIKKEDSISITLNKIFDHLTDAPIGDS